MRSGENPPQFIADPTFPYLFRLSETKPIPNSPFTRSLLRGTLKRHEAIPTLLDTPFYTPSEDYERPDWVPYKSPHISGEEAGIRAAFENAKREEANREILLIAKANYDRLYNTIKNHPGAYREDDVKILLLPKLLEKMIIREEDHVKKFHL